MSTEENMAVRQLVSVQKQQRG